MPEGLLDKLGEPQIRDLFRYLQSSGRPVTAVRHLATGSTRANGRQDVSFF